ncbi:MAG: hypothetical protein LBC19_00385, partial [Tannerella sp.]|nr:hypothetical protein [Tannerella sp.]
MNTMIIWMLQHTVSGDNQKVPQGRHFINRMLQHTEEDRNQKVPQGRHFINRMLQHNAVNLRIFVFPASLRDASLGRIFAASLSASRGGCIL